MTGWVYNPSCCQYEYWSGDTLVDVITEMAVHAAGGPKSLLLPEPKAMPCERCFKPIEDAAAHGLGLCPLEPRLSSGATMHDDQMPGGPQWIRNMGHEPVWVENKTQWKREMKARGLRNVVDHVGVKGSDKSPFTSRWI